MARFQTSCRTLLAVTVLLAGTITPSVLAVDEPPAPLTNLKSGISLSLSGVNGRDWAIERTCHDELIADQIIYTKADVAISLAHNERNTLMTAPRGKSRVLGVNGYDGEPNSADEGTIHYKIDRDMQAHSYIASRSNLPEWAPVYAESFRFDQLTYDGTRAVLGSIGDNGKPWGGLPGSTTKRFAYGQCDEAGNEWHTVTYWDDDLAVAKALKLGGRTGASDGHCVFVCVNPVTPIIQVAAGEGGQFYTTPIKTYHIPKIWPQTTYLTEGVTIRFANITGDQPIFYRIDDDQFRRYNGEVLAAEDLFMPKTEDEPSILEVCFGEDGPLLTRAFIFEPEHPAPGERHGFVLWADAAERERAIERVHNIEPFRTSYRTFRGNWYQGANYQPGATRGGWRSGASQASGALANALVANFEGPDAAMAEAKRCKQRLLYSARLQPIGFELNVQNMTPAKDFINELGQTTQQYADIGVAYDLLIACFRSSDQAEGVTPIEEIIIRDNLAKIAKSILQFRGNYSATSGGGDTHWAHGFELALGAIALAMPTYKSPYYGVSGGDRATVNDLADENGKYWNPFPDQAVTW